MSRYAVIKASTGKGSEQLARLILGGETVALDVPTVDVTPSGVTNTFRRISLSCVEIGVEAAPRLPESDGELLARLGTDGLAWAREFAQRSEPHAAGVCPLHDDEAGGLLHCWFANAIEAGRSAGYAERAEKPDTITWPHESTVETPAVTGRAWPTPTQDEIDRAWSEPGDEERIGRLAAEENLSAARMQLDRLAERLVRAVQTEQRARADAAAANARQLRQAGELAELRQRMLHLLHAHDNLQATAGAAAAERDTLNRRVDELTAENGRQARLVSDLRAELKSWHEKYQAERAAEGE